MENNQPNEVSKRFIACIEQLKTQKKIRSYRQFATQLDFLPQSLSEIINQRRGVTVELIRKAVEMFGFNPLFLFTGQGDLLLETESNPTQGQDQSKIYEQIGYVAALAAADYAQNCQNKRFLRQLPVFSLPDYKYKTALHRAFEVAGDSMETTLFAGDKVVGSWVEPEFWETNIKSSYVYIIVTSQEIHIKRVENQLLEHKQLLALSDNEFYQPQPIKADSIKEIWYVRAKISPFLPSPQRIKNNLTDEIVELRYTMQSQSVVIQSLTHTINELLKSKP